MSKCTVCGTECNGSTCSPKCRQKAYRARQGVTDQRPSVTPSVTDQGCNAPGVTDQAESVTDECNAPSVTPIHATDNATPTTTTQRMDSQLVDPIICQATGDVFNTMHEYQAARLDGQGNHKGINTINTGTHKSVAELGPSEINRVALPGDADYNGVAQCLV